MLVSGHLLIWIRQMFSFVTLSLEGTSPHMIKLLQLQRCTLCCVCVWKLPVLAKSYWLFPLQGCSVVTLQIPAVSHFCKVKHFMWVYTRTPVSIYKVSLRYLFYWSYLFLWHLVQMVVIVWDQVWMAKDVKFCMGLCFTLEKMFSTQLLLTWLTLYLDPS